MPDSSRTIVVLLIAVLALALVLSGLRRDRPDAGATAVRKVGEVSAAERAATFRFDPGVAEYDRRAFESAVAKARPEARRLIAVVDGLIDVHVAQTEAGVVGTTRVGAGPRIDVTVNLGIVARAYSTRGIDRTVLHELGHAIDFTLVPKALHDQLDEAIPRGYGCDQQKLGACADTRERFAESFAKWANGDIGLDLDLGYKVLPPDDLERWGAPLARLAH